MRLLILVVFLAIPLAAHAKRVALVIGNADYQSETPLKNAHADAVGLAETLVRLNFEVMHRTDLDRARFGETLRDFEKMMEGADVAAFSAGGTWIETLAVSGNLARYVVRLDPTKVGPIGNRPTWGQSNAPPDAVILELE